MSDFWHAAALWTAKSMLAGGTALLLAWLAVRKISDPARRQRVIGWSVRAAVLACGLTLLPAWLLIPLPAWTQADEPKQKVARAKTEVREAILEEPEEFVWIPVDEPLFDPMDPPVPVPLPDEKPTPSAVDPPPAAEVPEEEAPDRLAAVAPVVLIPYCLGVGFVVLRQLVGLIGLVRLRRAATPAPDAIQLRAAQLAKGRRPPRILVSERLASPVCFGVFRPTILLPKALVKSATAEQLRWVLAHELHHLRRGDPATGVWVGCARAIYFVLPWFWAVRRELNLAQEYLADAAAAGTQGADYAAFLVELSSRPGVPRSVRAVPSLAGVRAGQSDLYRRVTMLLQRKNEQKSRWGRAWSALALGSAVSAAVALAGIRLTADEPKKGDQKPDEPKPTEVRKTEKKPAEVREIEVRKTEKKPAEGLEIEVYILDKNKKDTADLEKAIEEAAKKGDVEGVKKLVARLKAVAAPVPPVPPLPPLTVKPVPPPPPGEGLFKIRVVMDDETQKLEKAIEKLKQAAEEVKDQPEAKAALEKSIEAYRKRIDEAVKKGELRAVEAAKEHKVADMAKLHQQLGQMKWAQVGGNPKAAMEQVQASVAEMMKVYEKQLSALKDDPKAAEALKESIKAYKTSMDQLAKQLAGGPGQFQFQVMPVPGKPVPNDANLKDALMGTYARKVPASGRLGIAIEPVPVIVAEQLDLPQGKGVILLSILPDSPAAKAGLKAHDILLEVAGKAVTTEDLPRVVAEMKPDQAFEVVVVRKGKKETVKGVTISAPKAEPKKGTSKSSSMSVSITNDQFEITAKEDALGYVLKGTVGDTEGVSVAISEGDKTQSYKGLKNVPSEHREKVEKFLKSVSK